MQDPAVNSLPQVAKTVCEFVTRELKLSPENFDGITDISDPALEALDQLVDAINNNSGKLSEKQIKKMAPLIYEQEKRAEIVDQLVLTHEYTRLSKFLKTRAVLEAVLIQAAQTGSLTPAESIAVLGMLTSEIKSMSARVKSGSASMKDLMTLLEKVDYTIKEREEGQSQQFSGTTPQEREITRRLAYKVSKLAKAQDDEQR